MKQSFMKFSLDEVVIDGLAIIAMLFFVTLSLSYSFPLLSIVILVFAVYYCFLNKNNLLEKFNYLKSIKKINFFPITLYFIALLSFFIHASAHYSTDPLIKSALLRAISFNIYAVIFYIEIKKDNLNKFFFKFSRLTAISISIISIFSLLRLYLCFAGIIIETDVVISEWQLFLTSLVSDNNFYSLGILSGIFSIIYLWNKGYKFPKICLILMTITLYFAASRRAAIISLLVFLFLAFKYSYKNKQVNYVNIVKSFILFALIIFSWLYTPNIIQKNFSHQSKKNFIESLGLNYAYISDYLPLARFRYSTLLNKNITLKELTNEFYNGRDSFFSISPNFFSIKNLFHGDSFKIKNTKIKLNEYSLSNNLTLNIAPTDGGRVERWQYAVEEFKTYTTFEKIFGVGGKYHLSFGKKFAKNQNEIILDYPHNPFLSLLLFSGILVTVAFILVYFFNLSLFSYPNIITLGLFPTAYFYNFVSLDLIWANYNWPFMIVFAIKLFEIYKPEFNNNKKIDNHLSLNGSLDSNQS